MKILIVSPSFWPAVNIGGPITSTLNFCKELIKANHEVTVYTTNVYLEDKNFYKDHKILYGIKIFYYSYIKLFEFVGETGWQFSIPLAFNLIKYYRKYDMVYVVGIWNFPSSFAIWLLSRKVNLIVAPHGSLDDEKMKIKGLKKKIYFHLIIKKYIPKVSLHLYSNSELKKISPKIKIDYSKLLLYPNGISDDELAQIKKLKQLAPLNINESKSLLFLGRLHPIKGIEILLEVMNELVKYDNTLILRIAGDGNKDYIDKIKSLIIEKELQNNIELIGFIDGSEKYKLFISSDVFVLLSYSEAFSMSIIESLSCGTPVLISNKCNFNEIESKKCGFVCELKKDDIVKKILMVLKNDELHKEFSSNAAKLVQEDYRLSIIVKNLLSDYNNLALFE